MITADDELSTTEENDKEESASRDMGVTSHPSECLSQLIQGGVISYSQL
jgi:hypothetical protein